MLQHDYCSETQRWCTKWTDDGAHANSYKKPTSSNGDLLKVKLFNVLTLLNGDENHHLTVEEELTPLTPPWMPHQKIKLNADEAAGHS
ncbi:jg7486 [Pararge aegeria aegeria]|uniref:Jg7486 protein n=1 Tax=Pararge aegeria aegeria TaxID=348720 RepID=A0A8S4R663_9NEOP|nr:jg7486 [Pararge aegeria aegeria]